MKTLPDHSIDLFLCDLPYGCLTAGKQCAWDIKINLDEFWKQVERLQKSDHTPVIHFCNARFGFELYNSKPSWFRYDLIWEKTNGVGFLCSNKQPLRSHELIYVFSKKGANYYRKDIEGDFPRAVGGTNHNQKVYGIADMPNTMKDNTNRRCVKSVITIANKKGHNKHPTQKPEDLYKFLIERYSKEGDTVLDPTAGSFTSVFTAHKLKRNAIGIELQESYFSKAISSIQKHNGGE